MPKLHRKIWIVYSVTIHCMAVGQNNESNRRKTFHDINWDINLASERGLIIIRQQTWRTQYTENTKKIIQKKI
jgi:hypothetical protein